jgi:hypothetical protein
MRKHSFTVPSAAPAPIEVREAQVFKLHASRHNLCPEVNQKIIDCLNRVYDAAVDSLISNPVKPSSYHEIIAKAWTELADAGSAVRKKDVRRTKTELFEAAVYMVTSCSLSDHLIKID